MLAENRLAVVIASGFLQDGSARHGALDLLELVGELAQGNKVQVHYRTWRDDPRALARSLYHRHVTHALLAGFSYGATFCARASYCLMDEGIAVPLAGLADGVHRWPFPRNYKNWRNVVPRRCRCIRRPPLRFAANVWQVVQHFQRLDEPSGDRVRCDNPICDIRYVPVHDRGHVAMDSLPAWHALLVAAAQDWRAHHGIHARREC